MNFDESIVRLHYLHIFFMLTKFQADQRLITISSINCLNSSFCSLKWCIKDEFKYQMVNYIQLAMKLAYMLRTYRTCNSMIKFSKYEFNNKLLSRVTFFSVTSGITWTNPIFLNSMWILIIQLVSNFTNTNMSLYSSNPNNQDLNMNFTKSSSIGTIY